MEKLLKEQAQYAKDYHIEESREKTVHEYFGEKELTQGMVDAFATRVAVDRDGNCEVALAYDDMLEGLMEISRQREADGSEG